MSLNIEGNKEVVAEVSERLKSAQSVVLAEYRGLPVEDITVLRSQARASGVYLRVLKNTLARRAVQGTPFEKLADQMVGPLAYGISKFVLSEDWLDDGSGRWDQTGFKANSAAYMSIDAPQWSTM